MYILFANPILIVAAVAPAIILLVRTYKVDRLEKEPVSLIVSLVVLGIISTALALVTESIGIALLGEGSESSVLYRFLLYFVVVGCSEEGFKYLLLKIRTWKSPAFNCEFDAVVYAVTVSLGFALWENISYSVQYGMGTALVRAITAVPGHACFGVFMGVFYGMAKRYMEYGYEEKSRRCRRLAFIVPAFLHGCYDYIASTEYVNFAWAFVAFVAVLFFVSFRMVKRLADKDSYLGIERGQRDE